MEEIIFLVATLAIEAPIALICLGRGEPKGKVLAITIGVNMITHPLAWQLMLHGASWIGVEGGVILGEMMVFAGIFRKERTRAASAALLMNVVSAVIGYLV